MNPMARTSRKKIGIYDDGVLLTDDVDSLDFTGSSVSGSSTNDAVTLTFTGGTSGYQDPLTGVVDGNNKTYTWTIAPSVLVIDDVPKRKVNSDGTSNWSGTTTTILEAAPNWDIFAAA